MTFDPSSDFAVFDGASTVAVWLPGAAEGVDVAGALRRAARHREGAPAGGDYRQADVVWHLPVANLAARPALGTLIVEPSGAAWAVLEVAEATLATRWACRARQLAIEPGPDTQIDLQRATWEPDAAGAPRGRYETYAAATPARLVHDAGAAEIAQEERRGADTIRVYLALRLDVRPDDRVLHDGRTYRVTRVVGLERLDRLPELDVEEVR